MSRESHDTLNQPKRRYVATFLMGERLDKVLYLRGVSESGDGWKRRVPEADVVVGRICTLSVFVFGLFSFSFFFSSFLSLSSAMGHCAQKEEAVKIPCS